MNKEYFKVLSSDGVHQLNCKLYVPAGEPIGIFQAVHGMTEHLERYDELLSLLCVKGFLCVIHDHLGHGKTANDEGELGFIAHKDGYKRLVDDVHRVYCNVSEKYKDKKHFLMGHSMGSFITRLYCRQYGEHLSGYIMMGSGAGNPVADMGLLLTKVIAKIKGEKHVSPFIDKMAFGGYNKKFSENSSRAWLSVNTENREKYSKDKYCTFKFTVSAMNDLIRLNKECNRKEWFENLPRNLNILIQSGSSDPVGEHSKGITKVYNTLAAQNRYNITFKLYKEARHEILNDFCKEDVIKDIINFLDIALCGN